jgi:hypothetical protein
MQSSSQFRTAGPNALSSAAWAQEFNEVKALGSSNSAVRTPEQTHIAIFWQSTPVLTWNAVARTLASDLDIVDTARLLAMENLAGADAAINCWNDKYYWDFWRPWNAIPRAAEDGNPLTEPDPTWAALITAPYPEHPSGHLCLDGARTCACWGRSSARTRSASTWRASNSPARLDTTTASRRFSRRSSRLASGRACTTAPPSYRRSSLAETSPTTWRSTTSSRSAADIHQGTG